MTCSRMPKRPSIRLRPTARFGLGEMGVMAGLRAWNRRRLLRTDIGGGAGGGSLRWQIPPACGCRAAAAVQDDEAVLQPNRPHRTRRAWRRCGPASSNPAGDQVRARRAKIKRPRTSTPGGCSQAPRCRDQGCRVAVRSRERPRITLNRPRPSRCKLINQDRARQAGAPRSGGRGCCPFLGQHRRPSPACGGAGCANGRM